MIFSQCLLIFYWWYKFIDDKTDAYGLGDLSWNEGFRNCHTSFCIRYFQCPFLPPEAFLLCLSLSDLSFLKRFSCWHEEGSSHIVKGMVRRVCRTCRKPSVLTAAQLRASKNEGPKLSNKSKPLSSVTNHLSLEEDPELHKRVEANKILDCIPWDPERETQLNCAWAAKPVVIC